MTLTTQREGKVQVPGGNVWYKIEGDGPGVPLLLLHGGPGAGHDYLEPMAALGNDRPVVFYDQLGCGKSDKPDDISLWQIKRFVDEVSAVRTALGLQRVHLLGQSWGGWLAIEYLLGKHSGVASVTLSNTSASALGFEEGAKSRVASLPEDVRQTIERCEADGTTNSPEYTMASFAFMQAHVCRIQPWPDYLMRTGANVETTPTYAHMWGPSEFTMTGNLSTWDRSNRLGEIDVPTLVISGPYDEAAPELAEELHAGIRGSEKVMIDETSHTPWIENTDAFFPVLRDFLRRNEPA
jgi:proline iminopeptidase